MMDHAAEACDSFQLLQLQSSSYQLVFAGSTLVTRFDLATAAGKLALTQLQALSRQKGHCIRVVTAAEMDKLFDVVKRQETVAAPADA